MKALANAPFPPVRTHHVKSKSGIGMEEDLQTVGRQSHELGDMKFVRPSTGDPTMCQFGFGPIVPRCKWFDEQMLK